MKKPIRLEAEYGEILVELLADLDGGPHLPLGEGESVGHRILTRSERAAVAELRFQVERALGVRRDS